MGEGSGRGSGRVRLFVGNRGSGRVNVSPGRVGPGPRKVTRGQVSSGFNRAPRKIFDVSYGACQSCIYVTRVKLRS